MIKPAAYISISAMALAVASAARAQTAEPSAASPPAARSAEAASDQEPQGLADIVVTAQRREESLQRAAVAVDVLTSDSILSAGVTAADDLTTLVPSLQVTNGGGSNTTFYLRGVGAFTNNSYADPAIAFNYDGVYIGRPASTAGVFFDIERIEVLKGPQGTLYGRNATGGAINVIVTKPRIGETSGYGNLTVGNYGLFQGQGALNVGLSDTAALRVSGAVVDRGGYLSDGSSDDRNFSLRGQVLLEPTSDLTIRVASDYYKARGRGGGGNYVARTIFSPATQTYSVVDSGLDPSVGMNDPRSSQFLTGTFAGLSGRTLLPLQARPRLNNRAWGLNGDVNWSTSLGTFTFVPSYRVFKQDSIITAAGFVVRTNETDRQVAAEARFATDVTRPLSVLVGGYYFRESIDSDFGVLQQVLASYQRYDQVTESLAGFGRATWRVAEPLRLVLGGRYTSDRKDFDGVANVLLDICTAPTRACPNAPLIPFSLTADAAISQLGLILVAPGTYIKPGDPAAANTVFRRGVTPLDLSRTDGKFTWRAGVEFDAGPQSLLYASYETGFRSGGFAFSVFNPTFGPESIRAFTVGSKNRFIDNRLQVNLELFYWKYRDQQVSHQGADPNVGQTFFTENIGQSTNKGAELELLFAPARNTRLSADVQYLDATYDSFVYRVPAFAAGAPTAPPFVGCAVARPPALTPTSSYTVDCSGKRAYLSPKWTVNFGVSQSVDVEGFQLTAEGTTHYQSSVTTGFDFLNAQQIPGYWISNASLTLATADKDWTVTGFVNNIEGNRYGSFSFYNGSNATISQVSTAPRTYGIRLGTRF